MYRLRVPQKPDLQSNLLKNGSLVSLVKRFISKLIQSRGQHSFSIMGHTESIIGLVGHAVFHNHPTLLWTATAAINKTMLATGFQ